MKIDEAIEKLKRPGNGAWLSADRLYRYALWREWPVEYDLFSATATTKKTIAFIGLNPSTADEIKDDPTITRCIAFAKAEGGTRLLMVNLFAFRATNPGDLLVNGPARSIGEHNDIALDACSVIADKLVCAWGTNTFEFSRPDVVLTMLRHNPLWCLKMNSDGSPGHPLYVKGTTQLIPFSNPFKYKPMEVAK